MFLWINYFVAQVAGGDGTVSLVLKSLVELSVHNKKPIPPTGIFPLGTGNDLSRSFGWVKSLIWLLQFHRDNSNLYGYICRVVQFLLHGGQHSNSFFIRRFQMVLNTLIGEHELYLNHNIVNMSYLIDT